MNENTIKIIDQIMKLNDKLNMYCIHSDVTSYGYCKYYGGDLSMCNNCGKLFISQNIEDLIND